MDEWADEMREEVKIFPYCVTREEATDKISEKQVNLGAHVYAG